MYFHVDICLFLIILIDESAFVLLIIIIIFHSLAFSRLIFARIPRGWWKIGKFSALLFSPHQMTDDFHEYLICTESIRHVAKASYRLMKYGDFTTESQLFMCHLSHQSGSRMKMETLFIWSVSLIILIYSIFIGSILLVVSGCLGWYDTSDEKRKKKMAGKERKKLDNIF